MKKKRTSEIKTMGMEARRNMRTEEMQLMQERRRWLRIFQRSSLGHVQIVTIVMLKANFQHTSASVEGMRNHQIIICSFLTLVANTVKERSMIPVLTIAVMFSVIQVVAHLARSTSQFHVIVVKNNKGFLVKLLLDQNSLVRTNVANF